jgi:hypothetical protein
MIGPSDVVNFQKGLLLAVQFPAPYEIGLSLLIGIDAGATTSTYCHQTELADNMRAR